MIETSHESFVLAAYGLGFALLFFLVINSLLRSLLVNQALDALTHEKDDEA